MLKTGSSLASLFTQSFEPMSQTRCSGENLNCELVVHFSNINVLSFVHNDLISKVWGNSFEISSALDSIDKGNEQSG